MSFHNYGFLVFEGLTYNKPYWFVCVFTYTKPYYSSISNISFGNRAQLFIWFFVELFDCQN